MTVWPERPQSRRVPQSALIAAVIAAVGKGYNGTPEALCEW